MWSGEDQWEWSRVCVLKEVSECGLKVSVGVVLKGLVGVVFR